MIHGWKALLLLTWIGLVHSCGDSRISGTDTGNPLFIARVLDSSGNPLEGARAYVWTRSADGTLFADTVYSDSAGYLSLRAPTAARVSVEVYWRDSLGAYGVLSADSLARGMTLRVGSLVDFRVSDATAQPVSAIFPTGRAVHPGVLARIPPGLWEIRYVRLGSAEPESLISLQVRVEDARQTPEDLEGLSLAAEHLAAMRVQTKGYVALSEIPVHPLVQQKVAEACDSGGFTRYEQCREGGCRVWQWQSDWISADEAQIPMMVSVVTGEGMVQCVLFMDTKANEAHADTRFYPLQRVRLP